MTSLLPVLVLMGGLSVYDVGDGYSGKELACGGTFKAGQHHVAIRAWRGRCGAKVRICSKATQRCVWTKVMDSGPFGCANRTTGKWRNCVRGLRRGERYRGVVDMTRAVWMELGRPKFLSEVRVEVYPGPFKGEV